MTGAGSRARLAGRFTVADGIDCEPSAAAFTSSHYCATDPVRRSVRPAARSRRPRWLRFRPLAQFIQLPQVQVSEPATGFPQCCPDPRPAPSERAKYHDGLKYPDLPLQTQQGGHLLVPLTFCLPLLLMLLVARPPPAVRFRPRRRAPAQSVVQTDTVRARLFADVARGSRRSAVSGSPAPDHPSEVAHLLEEPGGDRACRPRSSVPCRRAEGATPSSGRRRPLHIGGVITTAPRNERRCCAHHAAGDLGGGSLTASLPRPNWLVCEMSSIPIRHSSSILLPIAAIDSGGSPPLTRDLRTRHASESVAPYAPWPRALWPRQSASRP